MSGRRQNAGGFTLVEMLVVMAIVATLAAVAIPTLARMGVFSRDAMGGSARTVMNMLRAARVYGATFRTETGVVYVLNRVEDSRNGAPQIIADGIGMARKPTEEEFKYLEDSGQIGPFSTAFERENFRRHFFALVGDAEGSIRSLNRGTCIDAQVDDIDYQPYQLYPEGDPPSDPPDPIELQLLAVESGGASRQGLFPVRLYRFSRNASGDLQASEIPPRPGLDALSLGGMPLNEYFPAHVFRPSGEMKLLPYEPSTARFEIRVNASPDARLQDRFTESNLAVDVVRIELNKFSGRVRILEEENSG